MYNVFSMCLANQEVVLELISFVQRALPETVFSAEGTVEQEEQSDPVEQLPPSTKQVRTRLCVPMLLQNCVYSQDKPCVMLICIDLYRPVSCYF